MPVEDAYDEFLAFYPAYHDLHPKRRQNMERRIRSFEAFAGPIDKVTAKDFSNYALTLLHAEGLAPSTTKTQLNMIRPFLRWCAMNDYITVDEWFRFQQVKNPRASETTTVPKPYSPTEVRTALGKMSKRWPQLPANRVQQFLAGTYPYELAWKHARHLQTDAQIHLALHGGLRVSEIYNCTLDDLHPDNLYIVVRGKGDVNGNKIRKVPLTTTLRDKLRLWLEFRAAVLRNDQTPEHGCPWITLTPKLEPRSAGGADGPFRGEPLHSSDAIYETLALGLKITPHRLRHTAATEWLRAGMPLEKVQALLGHSDMQMTLRYAAIVEQDVGMAMAAAETQFEENLKRMERAPRVAEGRLETGVEQAFAEGELQAAEGS